MSTHDPPTHHPLDDTFDVHSLQDALGIGLVLIEELLDDGVAFAALWLGTHEGVVCDFVTCSCVDHDTVDQMVQFARRHARELGADRAVLWRTAPDLRDGPALAGAFFDRVVAFERAGVTLVDEIALAGDELRSLAVSTFRDPPGWDDVTPRLAALEDGEAEVW